MLPNLAVETKEQQSVAEALISTLAFFCLYELPLSSRRIHELLLGVRATPQEVDAVLALLVRSNLVVQDGNLFALKKWNQSVYNSNQLELTRKWQKIDRYLSWLAVVPFIQQVSVINSLALGTADADSDIDFFVIAKPNRLYFVRSVIIVLFKLLGVYKTRERIKDQFCFGFFVTPQTENLHSLLLKPEDPYLVFWLASLRPILGQREYERFMQDNSWIKTYFPNLETKSRLITVKEPSALIKAIKFIFEILLWLPVQVLEPVLTRIHIKHTFKLAENHAATSTTIAKPDILKLHAYDVRAEIAFRYAEVLEKIK